MSFEKHDALAIPASIYGILSGLSFFYFSWEYWQESSFVQWLFFGWWVPMLKSVVWPYFLFFAE